MKKVCISAVLMFVCGIAVVCRLSWLEHEKGDKGYLDALRKRCSQRRENLSIDFDLPSGHVPPCKWADESECRYLNLVWAEATTNLVDGNVEDMERNVSFVSERMKSICHEQWPDIVRPFYALLKDRLCKKGPYGAFSTEDEFNSYMAATLRAMYLMGDVEMQSYSPWSSASWWESDALLAIKAYGKQFADSGRNDLVQCADRFIEELIDRIESVSGLTRQYMHFDLKLQMKLVEEGVSTREQVIRGVRSVAYPLKVAGYVPKWLDEEFPLPQNCDDAMRKSGDVHN